MFRSVPAWYGPYLPDVLDFLTSEVARIGSSQIGLCAPFVVAPSMLEQDGVHLNPSGGERFLAHLDSQLQTMLVLASSDGCSPMDQEQDPDCQAITTILVEPQLDSIESIAQAVTNLSRVTSDFEFFARRRFKDDDLIFARLKEESDADLNKSREDRVVITGLPPPSLSVTSHSAKKEHYSGVVSRLVTLACAAADPLPKVLDVYINLRKDRGQPLIEARLDSVSGAQLFRREGAKLAKAEQAEFATLFFANSVTQSTRVRIEVLKALAKKLTTPTENAYVQGFISKPMLQYRVKEGFQSSADGIGRGYSYVDAISKFGTKLSDRDLTVAYTRAGTTFRGAMSQYFVVMSDRGISRGGRIGANHVPLGSRGGRGSRGSSGFRRGGSASRPAASGSGHRVENPDRGTKRTAEPSDRPSKKTENESPSTESIPAE